MPQKSQQLSPALRRLLAAADRTGLDPATGNELVGAVLRELGLRMTPDQWRELSGWLPWDVRSLAGARHAERGAPRADLTVAVAVTTDLSRPVAAVVVRAVLVELCRTVPAGTIPAGLTAGVPGL
jgi:hypothetical protein